MERHIKGIEREDLEITPQKIEEMIGEESAVCVGGC